MPFGLTNAATTFQSCMNHVFQRQLRGFVLVFLNDILIYSKTWEEHIQHLQEVLRILEEQQFYAKLSKREFGLTEMLYLGYIIGADGVKVHEENIQAIRDWPVPRDVTALRGFFGIYSYYRKFVKGFSQLAAPLTDLTKRVAFAWTDGAHATFDHLKEMRAIMHALAKFRQYLVCNKFQVKTDHKSLRRFMGQQGLNDRQQRWVSKVQAYDFDIEYVRGKHNVVANALSGRPASL
eukprot:PITA_25702